MATGIQQDPQEFCKLLVNKLEKVPCPTHFLNIKSIKDLFSGREKHSLICTKCQGDRSNVLEFTELSLNIENTQSVQDAVMQYQNVESLSGENSCFCETCGSITETLRSTTVIESPAVLCVHLLRYKYDRTTSQKQKVATSVNFTKSIEVGNDQYSLVSVVYHLGTSANGGHYVCDVFDESTESWWYLDDHQAFAIADPTVRNESEVVDLSKSSSSSKATGKKRKRKPKKGSNSDESDGDNGSDSEAGEVLLVEGQSRVHRNKDVYMLFFVKNTVLNQSKTSGKEIAASMEIRNEVQITSTEFEQEVDEYRHKRSLLEVQVATRKELYGGLKDNLTPFAPSDEFHLVPSSWLKRWIVGDVGSFVCSKDANAVVNQEVEILEHSSMECVGNCEYLCQHGSLKPSTVANFKVLSKQSFGQMLQNTPACQLDFDFTNENFRCHYCYEQLIDGRRSAKDEDTLIQTLLERIENEKSEFVTPHNQYWIARMWVNQLRRYSAKLQKLQSQQPSKTSKMDQVKKDSILEALKAGKKEDMESLRNEMFEGKLINEVLLCTEHKQPVLNFERRAVTVSEQTWQSITSIFSGYVTIKSGDICCSNCEDKVQQANQSDSEKKEFKAKLLASPAISQLCKRKKIFPIEWERGQLRHDEEVKFYLVDGTWLRRLRDFINDPSLTIPGPLQNEKLQCKHKGVLVRDHIAQMAEVFDLDSICEQENFKVSVGVKNGESVPHVEIVTAEQWSLLLHYFPPSNSNTTEGVVLIDCDLDVEQMTEKPSDPPFEAGILWNRENNGWDFLPEICLPCRAEMKQDQERNTKEFTNTSVQIMCMKGREQLDAYLQKKNADPASTSRRTRSNLPKKSSVCLSSEDTLALAKMKIFESFHHFDLPPNAQKIFDDNGVELVGNSKMLKELGVKSNSVLLVLLDEAASSDELCWLDGWNEAQVSSVECGFEGTLFSSKRSGQSEPSNDGVEVVEIDCEDVGSVEELSYEEQIQRAIEESQRIL